MEYRIGVGAMVVNKDKKVWVGERLNTPNAWQMPQGGIDPNENYLDAIYRELLEETGITNADVRLIAQTKGWLTFDWPKELQKNLWDGQYRGQMQRWFLLEMTVPNDVTNLNVAHPEFGRHQWVDYKQLPALIVDFKREMYEKIVTEFAWYFTDN